MEVDSVYLVVSKSLSDRVTRLHTCTTSKDDAEQIYEALYEKATNVILELIKMPLGYESEDGHQLFVNKKYSKYQSRYQSL